MAESNNQWIVKTEEGRIRGPYSTERVLEKISQGIFSGDELISKYPGSDWFPISQDPQFYDRLLEVLSASGSSEKTPSTPTNRPPAQKNAKTEIKSTARPIKLVQPTKDRFFDQEVDEDLDSAELEDTDVDRTRVVSTPIREPKTAEKKRRNILEDIELTNIKKKVQQRLISQAKKPLLFVVTICAVGILFLMIPSKNTDRIHLQSPTFQAKSAYSKDEQEKKTREAVGAYLQDTFAAYRLAEARLIDLIERDLKNLNLFGLLCLTHFELWPYAMQDSRDLQVVEKISMKASEVNPTHLYAYTCKAVLMIVKGQLAEAKALTEEVLASYSGNGPAPIPFYYFKAYLLNQGKDFLTAQGYANSAHQLWPQWLRAFLLEAEIYFNQGNRPEAYKILANIYQANKEHPATKVWIGIIESQSFANAERAKTFLNSGLKESTQMPSDLAAQGCFAMAQIYLAEKNQSQALSWAQKSYKLNPANESVKNMILQLGGRKKLEQTQVKAHQLILEGDQFVREGDCQSAQAHYKSAFEMDKNLAIAALKAGKCLWKLSFSVEAIEWMKKAIQADPKLIEGYVLLADYYSQRYDFVAAARTLAAAQSTSPKSHEVFRGYAQIELRRSNPKSAISYAKQALLIYNNDIEAMVIMANAQILSREDISAAFSMAARAVELDSSHREAQITYAKALAAQQGVDYGLGHLEKLINTFPLVSDYRLALGRMYFEDERYNDAEQVLRQLVEIQEKPKEPLIELGKVLRYQNNVEGALQALFRAAVFDPTDAEPFFLAGMLLLDTNKPLEAKQQLERVLLINPSYPLVRYHMGRAELMLKNPKGALDQANEEKKVNPNMAAAYSLAAEAYSDLNQFDLCAREYQLAIKLRPQGADIYVRVASCYRRAGNFDSASSMLNIAEKIESGNPSIYREQGALFEATGDLEKAVAAYRQYFILDPNATDKDSIQKRIQSLQR